MDNQVTVAPCASSKSVCYMLMPMSLGGNMLLDLAKSYNVNIVQVVVADWDNALTPWPAPGVMPGEADFAGGAPEMLEWMRNKLLPAAEEKLGLNNIGRRVLVGISLSGLFAVWAWMQCDDFEDIASLSGSFWYDDFAHWISSRELPAKQGRAYLSLGDEEGHTPVKRYQPVVADTATVVAALRTTGADVFFEWVSGTHYAPIAPRLQAAFKKLFSRV